jgi:glycosyltransferase involved in cell wall biosynthesis
MEISIGIPAYNAEKYLAQTLDSILAQTRSDWEAFIVDDGSQDQTAEIAEQYAARDARFRLIRMAHGGAQTARNAALAAMSPQSRYVIFLDADDTWLSDTLEILVATLEAHPEAIGAHGVGRYIDSDGKPFQPGFLEGWCRLRKHIVGNRLQAAGVETLTDFSFFAYRQCIPTTGALLIRRDVVNAVGEWDVNAVACQDWEMWLRLCLHGAFCFTDHLVINYRRHNTSMSMDQQRLRQAELYVRQRVMTLPVFQEQHRRLMRTGFHFSERERFRDKWKELQRAMREHNPRAAILEAARAFRHYLNSVRGIPG